LKLELSEIANEKKVFTARKESLLEELKLTRQATTSPDLAIKERAIKELPALEKSYTAMHLTADNSKPLFTRLSYLQVKLHIRKTQRISGFISFITFKN